MYWNVHHVIPSLYKKPKVGNSSALTRIVLVSTTVPESITLSSLLAYIEMYGNHNTINSARDVSNLLCTNTTSTSIGVESHKVAG